MIAMVVIMGLALYNGNYSKLGAVVDESNVQCGKDSNAGFPCNITVIQTCFTLTPVMVC